MSISRKKTQQWCFLILLRYVFKHCFYFMRKYSYSLTSLIQIADRDVVSCEWIKKFDQFVLLQEESLQLSNPKNLGDYIVTMKNILSSNNEYNVLPYHLTNDLIEKTQIETTNLLNKILQTIVNSSEITWSLDDAIEIYLTTGSGLIAGLIHILPFVNGYQNFCICIF